MASRCSDESGNRRPKRLRTLASSVEFSDRNLLLHQFVLDNSHPNESGGEHYINAVLLSASRAPANVVNAVNADGYSALRLAVLKNHLPMVKKLLSCLVNIDVNAKWWLDRRTALHIAAELGHSSIIEVLVNGGADTGVINDQRETPLCVAARLAKVHAVKMLVSKGADVNPTTARVLTPLIHAIRSGNFEAVEVLVRSGADVNAGDLRAPLSFAAGCGSLAMVKLLVSSGADVNIRQSFQEETPLHFAVRFPGLEIVEHLVGCGGADVDARDENGETPLHSAVCSGRLENAALLVDRGADVDARDRRLDTPLHLSVRQRNSVMGVFLEHLKDDAARRGNLEMARRLMDEGADLRAIDEDGKTKTPLHDAALRGEGFKRATFLSVFEAAYRGRAKVIRMLLDKGADAGARNADGETPLDLARNQSCMDALQNVSDGHIST